MQYRNIRTGTVINTDCEIRGEEWAAIEPPKTVVKTEKKPPEKKKKGTK